MPDLPTATGTLLGMRPGLLRPGHLYRAALEGTSLNLAWGVDRMRHLGVQIGEVRLVGGAAKNPLWRQILADVLGVPVVPLVEAESAALGAAIQAMWSVARATQPALSCDAVAAPFVQLGAATAPDRERTAQMQTAMAAFAAAVRRIYPGC